MAKAGIFEELFVLEIANNHWGDVERGLRIIHEYGEVAHRNEIKAAIKLQVRNASILIHKDFRHRDDIRYIRKSRTTALSPGQYATLVEAARKNNCIPMATPFDEPSLDTCVQLGVEILKIASSEINDWVLVEKIARTGLPVIASTGGASLKDIDDLVSYFKNRHRQIALNHCISLYPTEDHELELNQIDFLRNRYPGLTIGLSTHEYRDWTSSMMIAYAKGARTFERHIDIEDGRPVSPYCTLPVQCDVWFKAFKKAKAMCGSSGTWRRNPAEAEIRYLDTLVRGVYVTGNLPAGHRLTDQDIYLAIPLQKGQLSCREPISGQKLIHAVRAGEPLLFDMMDSGYSNNPDLRESIMKRGLSRTEAPDEIQRNGHTGRGNSSTSSMKV